MQPSGVMNPTISTSPSRSADGLLEFRAVTNFAGNEESSSDIHTTEDLFNRYKALMARHMPFVVIPPHIEASDLTASKPFLMQAIENVASFHDTSEQQKTANQLM